MDGGREEQKERTKTKGVRARETGEAKRARRKQVEKKKTEKLGGPGSILHTVSAGQQGHRAKELQTGFKPRAQ